MCSFTRVDYPITNSKMACTLNHFRRHEASRPNRLGVQYQIEETGTARLIFEEDGSGFMGMLLNQNGESVSIRGALAQHASPIDPTSASTSRMNVFIVDGEAGNQFRIEDVDVQTDPDSRPGVRPRISIKNKTIFFVTKDVLIGNRADVEIQTYLDPRLAQAKRAVYVGPMRIQMKANEKIAESVRRESLCDSCSTQILEQSDDFLA
uniref:LPS export ABC transporter periplasmic protein LptC n=2 Tax=Steinernema glaseri TaxID=37863 RepID=A0A1I8ACQ2_9BILA